MSEEDDHLTYSEIKELDDDDFDTGAEKTPDEYGNWCFNCREFIKDPDSHFKKMSGHNTVKKIIE